MTLYLDTSSLVKIYVDEPGSDDLRVLVDEADVTATSRLAYVEGRSALARRRREQEISAREFSRAKQAFESDWPHYLVISPTPELCRTAGDFAERYQLRAYDSLHLASYYQVAERVGVRNVEFSGFDTALNRAAHSLRRTLLKRAD